MKLLIINPNTTEAMTRKVEEAAAAFLPEGTRVTAVTSRFGPSYIASRAAFAVAAHGALDAYAAHGRDASHVLLACFGDPGLDAIREVTAQPVVSLVEASALEASAEGRRFSIVTGGERWDAMLRETLQLRGLAGPLASIRAVAPDGGMIARDPEAAVAVLAAACEACFREDGADAVVLGGIGLIGLADRVERAISRPVICSVMAGLRQLRAPALPGPPKVRPHRVGSVGLSEEMTRLLASGAA